MISSRKPLPRRWPLLLAIGAAAALAAAALSPVSGAGPDLGEARALAGRSLAALRDGNLSGARWYAEQATRADPSWGLAHALTARAALAQGDGASAEAALGRAKAAGFDMRRGHQMLAEARLLQRDPRAALTEAAAADPRYAGYALRVKGRALAMMGDPAAGAQALDAATVASPLDPAAWTDLARFRRTAGDQAGAIAAVVRAVAVGPNHTPALVLRGELVRDQFGLVAAIPWFEAALQRDPNDHQALIDYAATLGDAGRAGDMLAATRRALAVRPGDPQAFYLLAVLAARAGDAELARGLFQRTGDALAGQPGPLLLGAALDLDAGVAEQAVGKLRNLVGIQPMNLAARRLLALALLRGGAAQDALDVLSPMAQRPDADSYTLTLAARAFEGIGDRIMAARMLDRASVPARGDALPFSADDSVTVLAAAAEGDPAGEPSTAIPLIRGLLDRGDVGGALGRAQAVAAANPGAAPAALVLGDTLMAAGDVGNAVAAYRRAAAIRFDEPTMLRLTDALDRQGRREQAAATLGLFLSQNPRSLAAGRLNAHWQIAAGDFEAAIDTLERLRARIGDRDAALLAELAMAYDGMGDDRAARRFAAAAYALAPGNAAAADAYGWSLFGAKDAQGAAQLLEKAVAIAPGHAGLRWRLAQVYGALGRTEAARREARAALADPRFGDRAAAMAVANG